MAFVNCLCACKDERRSFLEKDKVIGGEAREFWFFPSVCAKAGAHCLIERFMSSFFKQPDQRKACLVFVSPEYIGKLEKWPSLAAFALAKIKCWLFETKLLVVARLGNFDFPLCCAKAGAHCRIERFVSCLMAVFSQTTGSKKGLFGILVSQVLACQRSAVLA